MNAPHPILATHPALDASAEAWIGWYWSDFLPAWALRARDPVGGGFCDFLNADGVPQPDRKTVLAQARLLFTFAHLGLLSGDPAHFAAATAARDALRLFRKPSGLYRRGLARDGLPSGHEGDHLATSYDQSFVILGLSTWGVLTPSEACEAELEANWFAIQARLVDPVTGLLLEHDGLADPADISAPPRAQNPHMHLYEAALQAFEMTRKPIWLARAQTMRAKGLEYFFDAGSGTIMEFLAPDLSVLPGRDGQRREIGHQCEWAWLLQREVALGGDAAMTQVAATLMRFADQHGFATSGAMQGAAFDAVSCDTGWHEDRFLLWPQTEALKVYAIRAADPDQAGKARALVQLIFQRYFAGRAAFANQLDAEGAVLWDEALSRLHYHLVLGLTEGARAGLWPKPQAAAG